MQWSEAGAEGLLQEYVHATIDNCPPTAYNSYLHGGAVRSLRSCGTLTVGTERSRRGAARRNLPTDLPEETTDEKEITNCVGGGVLFRPAQPIGRTHTEPGARKPRHSVFRLAPEQAQSIQNGLKHANPVQIRQGRCCPCRRADRGIFLNLCRLPRRLPRWLPRPRGPLRGTLTDVAQPACRFSDVVLSADAA